MSAPGSSLAPADATPAMPATMSSRVRFETRLWIAQRASAAVLALAVIVHLATLIVAVRGGLSAAEILGRTRGSPAWAAFYAVFVLAVAVHAPIGLRTLLAELTGGHKRAIDVAMLVFAALVVALGARAIVAVTLP